MDYSLSTYYPLFIYLLFVLAFAVAAMFAAHVLGPHKPKDVKLMPYESGMDPIGDARQKFDVKFYLIAILFLVFDVELLFLYPLAAAYGRGPDGEQVFLPAVFNEVVFWGAMIFLALVVVGFVYDWRRGVFRWR